MKKPARSSEGDTAVIPAYGVFEGGGMKGAALAGALAAAHNLGIRFRGVAGTSAGAVVAAFYAAGFHDESELRRVMTSAPFTTFRDGFNGPPPDETVSGAMKFATGAASTVPSLIKQFTEAGWIGRLKLSQKREFKALLSGFTSNYGNLAPLLERLSTHFGIYDGDALKDWVERTLQEKIRPTDGRVLFQDLPQSVKLSIVATRLDRRNSLVVYTTDSDPTMPVAEAVRQSTAIPFYFRPVEADGWWHIDGGAASNFPAWAFSKPPHEERDPLPVIGFRLVEKLTLDEEAALRKLRDVSEFSKAVFRALLWAGYPLQELNVSRLHNIEIDTRGVGTVDFGLSQKEQDALFEGGKDDAERRLRELSAQAKLRRDRTPELEAALKALCEEFARAIGFDGSVLTDHGRKLARASVMIEAHDPDFRKVVSTWNFDGDRDAELVIPKYAGLTGAAWLHPGFPFWANLAEVREAHATPTGYYTYGLSPEVQRLVRPQAEAMVAVAVTTSAQPDLPIATVAVDTDVPVLTGPPETVEKIRKDAQRMVVFTARVLAGILQRLYT